MLNRLNSELAPLLIIEEIKSQPKVMNLLRSYAKTQGIAIEECFSGVPTKNKIALLSREEIGSAVSNGAYLFIDKQTPMTKIGQKLGKVLEGYLNE